MQYEGTGLNICTLLSPGCVATITCSPLQGYSPPSPQALSFPVPIYVHACGEGTVCSRVKCLAQQHALALARAEH